MKSLHREVQEFGCHELCHNEVSPCDFLLLGVFAFYISAFTPIIYGIQNSSTAL